jgi:hypothetical protein
VVVREQVNDLALGLVAPLQADDTGDFIPGRDGFGLLAAVPAAPKRTSQGSGIPNQQQLFLPPPKRPVKGGTAGNRPKGSAWETASWLVFTTDSLAPILAGRAASGYVQDQERSLAGQPLMEARI